MSQTDQPDQPNQQGGSSQGKLAIIGLVLIAVLGLAFAGYTVMNPHAMTVTEQQFLTNTQSLYSAQTQTVSSVITVTSATTVARTTPYGYGYGQYYGNCGYYGCYYPNPTPNFNYSYPNPGSYYNLNYLSCQSTGSNNMVQCWGYLYQNSNGCVLLAVQVDNGFTSQVYQYYTLQNLPSTYPPPGTWVTVNGQLYQAYNASPSAACPASYINVTSISQ